MHYRVFYYFEQSGESIASTSPLEMSARSIRERLLRRLRGEDDYLGIMDGRDNVLQIQPVANGVGRFWVELPVEEARASYGRHMDLAQLEAFITEMPSVLDRSVISNLEYRPW